MQAWIDEFGKVPLPYKYVQIPHPSDPPNESNPYLKFFVHEWASDNLFAAHVYAGFQETTDSRRWNVSCGCQYNYLEYQQCEAWQKITHFGAAFFMGRKDYLTMRMQELRERIGDGASFYPESYCIPKDKPQLEQRWKEMRTWILKPDASSCGDDIQILNSKESDIPDFTGIAQVYIERPLLIQRRKFDIRLYVYVPSIQPLRVYLHHSGLVRFCTREYDLEHGRLDDRQMHLTNVALNKKDDVCCEERVENSKWSLDFFREYMEREGHSWDQLMKEFESVIIKSVIAGVTWIRKIHFQWVPHRHTAHELYGADLILDEDGKAHLLEINISPSMNGFKNPLDHRVKYPLCLDVLRMGRIIDCNPEAENPCPGVVMMDERYHASMTSSRITDVESGKLNPWDEPVFADFVIVRDFLEEQQIDSGFRLIYPNSDALDYVRCYDGFKYHDIVLQSWIRMSDAEKRAVLDRHFDIYTDEVSKICQHLTASEIPV